MMPTASITSGIRPLPRKTSDHRGFTLVELLVSMTVLSIIMLVSVSVISQTQKTWMRGSARIEQFREARVAFESITQTLRQATLNTYTTYKYPNETTIPQTALDAPTAYVRHSELQFVTGPAASLLTGASAEDNPGHAVFFQATLGVSNRAEYRSLRDLLCGRGYFVTYGTDLGWRPPHVVEERRRFRLMEYRPTAETNDIYSVNPGEWFTDALSQITGATDTQNDRAYTRPVAENIIALILSPRVAPADVEAGQEPTWIAPGYQYDSSQVQQATAYDLQGTQHLLPPIVVVTLVAIDEASARKLQAKYNTSSPPLLQPTQFINAEDYNADLRSLEETLINEKLTYRIFSNAIALRNAKWANQNSL